MHVVYIIKSLIDNRLYVGSALNFKSRKNRHLNDLSTNKHHCKFLQRAYNKYGKENFVFEVLEYVEQRCLLLPCEQFWLDTLKPEYNNSKVAGNCFGVKHSEATRQNNSLRNSGFGNGNARLAEKEFREIVDKRKFTTEVELAKQYNVHRTTIQRVLKRYSIPTKKVMSDNGRQTLSNLAKSRRNRANPVIQYSLEKEIIETFPSANEAAKKTGVSIAQIIECCKGNVIKPRKFVFTFAK